MNPENQLEQEVRETNLVEFTPQEAMDADRLRKTEWERYVPLLNAARLYADRKTGDNKVLAKIHSRGYEIGMKVWGGLSTAGLIPFAMYVGYKLAEL